MVTQVLKPDPSAYRSASEILRSGGLVAFPTETVYGLGANAFDSKAVLSVFAAKGRPADNPLIVHIHSTDQLDELCELPSCSEILINSFWPGPLTMLFRRKSVIPDEVTAGLDTVAIRMPDHPVASRLLKECSLPIAAPSANLSGRPSPTTAAHVLNDMNGRIPLILDGGACEVGVESTVLDTCHGQPTILRPGGITREMLEDVLHSKVALAGSILRPLKPDETALSPGMRYKHYSPECTVTLVSGKPDNVIKLMRDCCTSDIRNGHKACVMCFTEHVDLLKDCCPHDLGSIKDHAETARRLFNMLRSLDEEGMDHVYSEVMPPDGVGLAVMNRLGRAAAFQTIEADKTR